MNVSVMYKLYVSGVERETFDVCLSIEQRPYITTAGCVYCLRLGCY
jgi:hypothetical protein